MKLNKFFVLSGFIFALSFGLGACNSGSSSDGPSIDAPPVAGLTNGSVLAAQSGSNVMSFTVNGATCAAGSYANKPCVNVTICNPGSGTCQTVTDILLDTGSYGLRVFKSAIASLTLPQKTARQGGVLTECAKFGDGSAEWGPVESADVTLGGETASNIPIQVLDPSFGTVPPSCGTPDASPAAAGFNGILGVGLFGEDCGSGCNGTHSSNGMYFSCVGATCVGGSSDVLTDQVINPVAAFPTDNNGLIIQLPSIASSGASSVPGYIIFGVGTQTNNSPAGLTKYAADAYGQFLTDFNGTRYDSFLDTGSNGLYFDRPTSLASCSGSSWFCPNSVISYSAVNLGSDGAYSGTVNFQIANASGLFGSGHSAFNDLGGNAGNMFDFGLPFYFGRNVFLGIDGKSSTLGIGPYWAY